MSLGRILAGWWWIAVRALIGRVLVLYRRAAYGAYVSALSKFRVTVCASHLFYLSFEKRNNTAMFNMRGALFGMDITSFYMVPALHSTIKTDKIGVCAIF